MNDRIEKLCSIYSTETSHQRNVVIETLNQLDCQSLVLRRRRMTINVFQSKKLNYVCTLQGRRHVEV